MKVTRLQKVLFPEDGITKEEVIRYYREISPWMLPHLRDRPLALQRFPDGIQGKSFFQKAAAQYYPAWIRKVTVSKAGGTVNHVVCDDSATLVYLANQAAITLHPWLSRADEPHRPDQIIFDLDPSGENTEDVVAGATGLRRILNDLELPSYLKSTGGRGLHVCVPIAREQDFDSVRGFARHVAQVLAARDSGRFTLEQSKSKRAGRVFLDINRNAYAQTAVAAYSIRARKGAPVAVPLEWAELEKRTFRPDGVTIRTIFRRLDKIQDPWKNFEREAVSLDRVLRKTDEGKRERSHAV